MNKQTIQAAEPGQPRRWEDSVSFLACRVHMKNPTRTYHECFAAAQKYKQAKGN